MMDAGPGTELDYPGLRMRQTNMTSILSWMELISYHPIDFGG